MARLCPAFADDQPLDPDLVHTAVEAFAAQGMCVLAIASAAPPEAMTASRATHGSAIYAFLGLLAWSIRPRREALDAVQACRRAGIVVKMVTGDHPATAGAMSRIFALLDEAGNGAEVVTGRRIEAATDDELVSLAREHHVFARVAPEHKLRLVKALQADGQIAAMTGDDVNDAPALK